MKPLAAYLAATGQIFGSISTLIVGELLKLVIVERLFSLTRDKLLTIPAFAWAYGKFRQGKAWLKATAAWRALQSLSKTVRAYFLKLKTKARAGIPSLRRKKIMTTLSTKFPRIQARGDERCSVGTSSE